MRTLRVFPHVYLPGDVLSTRILPLCPGAHSLCVALRANLLRSEVHAQRHCAVPPCLQGLVRHPRTRNRPTFADSRSLRLVWVANAPWHLKLRCGAAQLPFIRRFIGLRTRTPIKVACMRLTATRLSGGGRGVKAYWTPEQESHVAAHTRHIPHATHVSGMRVHVLSPRWLTSR